MIDSHCHLADDAFSKDLNSVIDRAREAGLTSALCILDPTNEHEGDQFRLVSKIWPEVCCAVGVHPHHANRFQDRLEDLASSVTSAINKRKETRALGEIGLDYHYDFSPREVQREVFRRQLCLARDRDLPVVIHTREADIDTVSILREEGRGSLRGVIHCFTGDRTLARQALDLGFYVSFSGIVTFRRAEEIREAAKLVPSSRLLVETDAPYLAPIPHRGKRNEPAWVSQVVVALSETRQESVSSVVEATSTSFLELFKEKAVDR